MRHIPKRPPDVLYKERKKLILESLFNKVAGLQACISIKKETLMQVLSCEHCKIFKNTSSEAHFSTTASVFLKSKLQIKKFTD